MAGWRNLGQKNRLLGSGFLAPNPLKNRIPPEPPVDNLFAAKTPLYLKILDRLQALFSKQGIDYAQLRLLVQVKMSVNERAMINPAMGQSKKKTSLLATLLLQMFMGLIAALVLLFPMQILLQYVTIFSFLSILMITSLISQLAQVLLSAEDLLVLPVRPIATATLNLAKIIQVAIYQIGAMTTYALPMVIISFVRYGPWIGLLSFGSALLFSALMLLLALSLYLLAARYFSGEKLRDIIAYLQISMAVLTGVGYQFLNQLMMRIRGFEIRFQWWQLLLPPFWFAAPMHLVDQGYSPLPLLAVLLIFLSLLSLLLFYIKNAGLLEERLQQLIQDKGSTEVEKGRLRSFFARLLSRDKLEKNYFDFTWQMMRHERSFKTTTYPVLAMYSVLPYVMAFSMGSTQNDPVDLRLPFHLFLYFILILIPTMLLQVQMSDYAAAAWIFRMLPDTQDAAFARGVAKACWAKLFLPLFSLQVLIQALLNGAKGVFTVLNLIFLTLILLMISAQHLDMVRPFTKARAVNQMEGCGGMLIFALIAFALAAIQELCAVYLPFGLYIYTAALLLLCLALLFLYRGKRRFANWG